MAPSCASFLRLFLGVLLLTCCPPFWYDISGFDWSHWRRFLSRLEDAIEEIAQVRAREEGKQTETISREEVFKLLE